VVKLASNQKQQQMEVPKELAYFMKQFKGHTTFVGATKQGIFSNYPGNITELYSRLAELNDLGHSIYFTVNETAPSGRKMQDLESIRAIFADDDTPRSVPMKFPLEPSIIVQTSKTETGKFKHQYYWLTKTPDYVTWELVMEGIIKVYDTDPGAKDLARILRVPGFYNHKYDPPSMCKMIQCTGNLYHWTEILKNFPPIEKTQRQATAKVLSGEEFNEHAHFQAFLKGESIAPSMNALIAHWGHHYSASNMRNKVDQLFEEVPPEILLEHKARYFEARKQIDKFIKSIKSTIAKDRAEDIMQQTPVTSIAPIVPDSLEWNWSILQSNPIPEDVIPTTLLQAAEEIGDWTGVGKDPAILSAVFITSALLSKNVTIHEIDDDLTTHCQSGICIVMDTGARKSAIYNQMNKPFFEYEDQIKEEWEAVRFKSLSAHKTLTAQLNKLRKEYDQKEHTDAEFDYHIEQCGELEMKIDKIQLQEPWLRSADVTEEKLVRKLYHNQGVMAVISDDARQVINNIKGKYSGSNGTAGTGESVYINALTGSDILYERVGNEQDMHIRKPVLNALLFVQPDAALALKNSDMFVPSGLAARLPMYFYPVSGADIVGNTSRRSIVSARMEPYYEKLRLLCLRRISNPLHIRLSEAGMEACSRMDVEFAKLLKTTWRGHYDKSNKLITLSLMYATCFASLDDPAFSIVYNKIDAMNGTYTLPIKYLNSGFMFAKALFGQSITSHQMIAYESMPRKAESLLTTIQKWYSAGKIWEGFVMCGALQNSISPSIREFVPDILDLLVEKRWLLPIQMTDDKRKLNGGFPDKLVDKGEIVLHLNLDGIKQREALGLDGLEETMMNINPGGK